MKYYFMVQIACVTMDTEKPLCNIILKVMGTQHITKCK